MKKVYKEKPKQKQIDNILRIYAAIGAAAKESPAPELPKVQNHDKNNVNVQNR